MFHKCKKEFYCASNVIQYDDMGYPLRLCIVKCHKCGKTEQMWIDTKEKEGDSHLKWEKPRITIDKELTISTN